MAAGPAQIVVALDGSKNAARKGTVQLFSFPELAFVADVVVGADLAIFDLKLSAEGNALAVAASDNTVHVYTQTEG